MEPLVPYGVINIRYNLKDLELAVADALRILDTEVYNMNGDTPFHSKARMIYRDLVTVLKALGFTNANSVAMNPIAIEEIIEIVKRLRRRGHDFTTVTEVEVSMLINSVLNHNEGITIRRSNMARVVCEQHNVNITIDRSSIIYRLLQIEAKAPSYTTLRYVQRTYKSSVYVQYLFAMNIPE